MQQVELYDVRWERQGGVLREPRVTMMLTPSQDPWPTAGAHIQTRMTLQIFNIVFSVVRGPRC